jgi:putative nucleotidyltransferase-like protein
MRMQCAPATCVPLTGTALATRLRVTTATVQTPSRHASEFYKRVIQKLQASDVEFLVGGAFAFVRYTGIGRDTKDLDLFIRRSDWDRVTALLAEEGIVTDLVFPHWLGKAFGGREREFFVDLIFSGGNGIAEVDDQWFANAVPDESLGYPVRLMPLEEMIWSKAFVMERERFDGADLLHLIRAKQNEINWPRLIARFGENWRVLLSHLVLFPYVYPTDPSPRVVIDELLRKALEQKAEEPGVRLCRGTLLSRAQYLVDVSEWNYVDARQIPYGSMTPEEVDIWTSAIDE